MKGRKACSALENNKQYMQHYTNHFKYLISNDYVDVLANTENELRTQLEILKLKQSKDWFDINLLGDICAIEAQLTLLADIRCKLATKNCEHFNALHETENGGK